MTKRTATPATVHPRDLVVGTAYHFDPAPGQENLGRGTVTPTEPTTYDEGWVVTGAWSYERDRSPATNGTGVFFTGETLTPA